MATEVFLEVDSSGNLMPTTYLLDNTNKQSCGASYDTNEATYYAQFIYERQSTNGVPNYLAEFDSGGYDYLYGQVSGAAQSSCIPNNLCAMNDQSIYIPYSNGWFIKEIMENSGTVNINVGNVGFGGGNWGAFSEQWSTSANT